MKIDKDIFLGKKILIYGLGKSGISTFKFLKKRADVYLFDDNQKTNLKIATINQIIKKKFDGIIVSPGIDISNCKLSKFLNKNLDKIYTDLDVFYSSYKNTSIAITGTNGKSTTAKILFDILIDQKKIQQYQNTFFSNNQTVCISNHNLCNRVWRPRHGQFFQSKQEDNHHHELQIFLKLEIFPLFHQKLNDAKQL